MLTPEEVARKMAENIKFKDVNLTGIDLDKLGNSIVPGAKYDPVRGYLNSDGSPIVRPINPSSALETNLPPIQINSDTLAYRMYHGKSKGLPGLETTPLTDQLRDALLTGRSMPEALSSVGGTRATRDELHDNEYSKLFQGFYNSAATNGGKVTAANAANYLQNPINLVAQDYYNIFKNEEGGVSYDEAGKTAHALAARANSINAQISKTLTNGWITANSNYTIASNYGNLEEGGRDYVLGTNIGQVLAAQGKTKDDFDGLYLANFVNGNTSGGESAIKNDFDRMMLAAQLKPIQEQAKRWSDNLTNQDEHNAALEMGRAFLPGASDNYIDDFLAVLADMSTEELPSIIRGAWSINSGDGTAALANPTVFTGSGNSDTMANIVERFINGYYFTQEGDNSERRIIDRDLNPFHNKPENIFGLDREIYKEVIDKFLSTTPAERKNIGEDKILDTIFPTPTTGASKAAGFSDDTKYAVKKLWNELDTSNIDNYIGAAKDVNSPFHKHALGLLEHYAGSESGTYGTTKGSTEDSAFYGKSYSGILATVIKLQKNLNNETNKFSDYVTEGNEKAAEGCKNNIDLMSEELEVGYKMLDLSTDRMAIDGQDKRTDAQLAAQAELEAQKSNRKSTYASANSGLTGLARNRYGKLAAEKEYWETQESSSSRYERAVAASKKAKVERDMEDISTQYGSDTVAGWGVDADDGLAGDFKQYDDSLKRSRGYRKQRSALYMADAEGNAEYIKYLDDKIAAENEMQNKIKGRNRLTDEDISEMDKDSEIEERLKNGGKKSKPKSKAGRTLEGFLLGSLQRYLSYGVIYKGIDNIVKSLTNLVKIINQLNVASTNLRIVTGKTLDETNGLIRGYQKMGKELGVSTALIAQSANEWLRQGYGIEDTNNLIDASIKLSKLGMIESGKATSYLTSTLKGFKLEASDALSVVDKLTTLDMNYATSAGDIAEAISRVASVAQDSNMSLDSTAAMLTTIMDITQMDSSMAGTSLRSMLARYGKVSASDYEKSISGEDMEGVNDIDKVLRTIGITIRSSSGSMRAFDDVLGDVAEKWINLTDIQKNAIATAMAGTRQRNAFISLVSNYEQVKEAEELSENSEGQADTKYKAYQESIAYQTERIKNAWEGVALAFEDDKTILLFMKLFADTVERTIPLLTGLVQVAAGLGLNSLGGLYDKLIAFCKRPPSENLQRFIGTDQKSKENVDDKSKPEVKTEETISPVAPESTPETIAPETSVKDSGSKKDDYETQLDEYEKAYGPLITARSERKQKLLRRNKLSGSHPLTRTASEIPSQNLGDKSTDEWKAETNKLADDLKTKKADYDQAERAYRLNPTPENRVKLIAANQNLSQVETNYNQAAVNAGIITTPEVKTTPVDTSVESATSTESVPDTSAETVAAAATSTKKQRGWLVRRPSVKSGTIYGVTSAISGLTAGNQSTASMIWSEAKKLSDSKLGKDKTTVYDIQSTTGDRLLNGALQGGLGGAGAAAFGPVGAIAGSTAGDVISTVIKEAIHKEDIARADRVKIANKVVDKMNSIQESVDNIKSIMTKQSFSEYTAEDWSNYSEFINQAKLGLISEYSAVGDQSLEEIFLSNLSDLDQSFTSTDVALNALTKSSTSTADAVKIMGAYAGAVTKMKALAEYGAQEDEIKNIQDKMNSSDYALVRQYIAETEYSGGSDTELANKLRSEYSKKFDNEDIEKAVLRYKGLEYSLKEIDEELNQGLLSAAMETSGLTGMSELQSGSLAAEYILYMLGKEWEEQGGKDVFGANGALTDDARASTISAVRSASNLSNVFNSKYRFIGDYVNDNANNRREDLLQKYSGQASTFEELYELAKTDKLTGNAKTLESDRNSILLLDTQQISIFAHKLGMTTEQLEASGDEFAHVSEANLSGTIQELQEHFTSLSSVLDEITERGSLSVETLNKVISEMPYLLKSEDANGNTVISQDNIAKNLINILVNGSAVNEYAAYATYQAENDPSRMQLFKDTYGGSEENWKKIFGSNISENDLALLMDSDSGFDKLGDIIYGNEDALKLWQNMITDTTAVIDQLTNLRSSIIKYEQKMLDNQISNLQSVKDSLNSVNEQREEELKLIRAKQQLENSLNEKKRVYRAGIGWTYEADQQAVSDAQKAVTDAENEKEVQNIQYQIDLLNHEKEILGNVEADENWNYLKYIRDTFQDQIDADAISVDSLVKLFGNKDLTQNIQDAVQAVLDNRPDVRAQEKQDLANDVKVSINKANADWEAYQASVKNNEDLATQTEKYKTATESASAAYTNIVNARNNGLTADLYGDTQMYVNRNGTTQKATIDEIYTAPENLNNITSYKTLHTDPKENIGISGASFQPNVFGLPMVKIDFNSKKSSSDFNNEDVSVGVYNLDKDEYTERNNVTCTEDYLRDLAELSIIKGGAFDHWIKYGGSWYELKNYYGEKWYQKLGNWISGNKWHDADNSTEQLGYGTHKKAQGSYNFMGGSATINELGLEAIVTPSGTITSLPAHTGIVPADLTKNLYNLGEIAPNLIQTLKATALNSSNNKQVEDNSLDIDEFNATFQVDNDFDFERLMEQARQYVATTKNRR